MSRFHDAPVFRSPAEPAAGRAARIRATCIVVGCGLAAAAAALVLDGAWPRAVHAVADAGAVAWQPRPADDARFAGDREQDAVRRAALAGDPAAALALGRRLAAQAEARGDDPRLAASAAMWLDRARQEDQAAALPELQALFERYCWRRDFEDHWLCDLGE